MDLVREAPVGQLIRYLTGNRVFLYPEEQPGYELPATYQAALEGKDSAFGSMVNCPSPSHQYFRLDVRLDDSPFADPRPAADTVEPAIGPQIPSDRAILVDWYSDRDTANPLNWSSAKRTLVVAVIVSWLSPTSLNLRTNMWMYILSACIPLLCMQDPRYIHPASSG